MRHDKATGKCLNNTVNTDNHWANVAIGWVLWKSWEMRPSASRRKGRIALQLSVKTWQFLSVFSLEHCNSLYIYKIEYKSENFKNPQQLISIIFDHILPLILAILKLVWSPFKKITDWIAGAYSLVSIPYCPNIYTSVTELWFLFIVQTKYPLFRSRA